jgi:hypothetical protein
MNKKICCWWIFLGAFGFYVPVGAMKQELSCESIKPDEAMNVVKKIAEVWLVTAHTLVREYCKVKNYEQIAEKFSYEEKRLYLDSWVKNIIQEKKSELFFCIQQAACTIIDGLGPELKEKIKEFLNIEKTLKNDETIVEPKGLLSAVQMHCISFLKAAKNVFPVKQETEDEIVWDDEG